MMLREALLTVRYEIIAIHDIDDAIGDIRII